MLDRNALPVAETSLLQDLESLVREKGYLKEGELIPVMVKDGIEFDQGRMGLSAENNTLVVLCCKH